MSDGKFETARQTMNVAQENILISNTQSIGNQIAGNSDCLKL